MFKVHIHLQSKKREREKKKYISNLKKNLSKTAWANCNQTWNKAFIVGYNFYYMYKFSWKHNEFIFSNSWCSYRYL